jgi:hypothetical protein
MKSNHSKKRKKLLRNFSEQMLKICLKIEKSELIRKEMGTGCNYEKE